MNTDSMVNTMVILLVVSIPLGIWKMIDIVVWMWQHVSFVVN